MNIGIDVDGVIFDTERLIKFQAEIYDLLFLRKKGATDKSGMYPDERYKNSWLRNHLDHFKIAFLKPLCKEANLIPGAKSIITWLKEDGNTLVIISARGTREITGARDLHKIALQSFKKHGLTFDEYCWGQLSKVDACKKYNIDLMIDDSPSVCKELSENGIKTLYFRDVNMKKLKPNENLIEVNNWAEVYREYLAMIPPEMQEQCVAMHQKEIYPPHILNPNFYNAIKARKQIYHQPTEEPNKPEKQ